MSLGAELFHGDYSKSAPIITDERNLQRDCSNYGVKESASLTSAMNSIEADISLNVAVKSSIGNNVIVASIDFFGRGQYCSRYSTCSRRRNGLRAHTEPRNINVGGLSHSGENSLGGREKVRFDDTRRWLEESSRET